MGNFVCAVFGHKFVAHNKWRGQNMWLDFCGRCSAPLNQPPPNPPTPAQRGGKK